MVEVYSSKAEFLVLMHPPEHCVKPNHFPTGGGVLKDLYTTYVIKWSAPPGQDF